MAFANARGGTLLLGVRNDGTVGGEHLTNDLKAKINSLARNCKPSISVSMDQVDDVVAIEVEEGSEKPYSCGSGIRKMKKIMAEAGLTPPEFDPNGFFRVVFRRSPDFTLKRTGRDPSGVREKTGEKTGEKIIKAIRERPEITTAELAELTGLTVKGIEWNLKKLKNKGILRRVGPDKGGYWEVIG